MWLALSRYKWVRSGRRSSKSLLVLLEDVPFVALLASRVSEAAALDAALVALPLLASRASPSVVILLQLRLFSLSPCHFILCPRSSNDRTCGKHRSNLRGRFSNFFFNPPNQRIASLAPPNFFFFRVGSPPAPNNTSMRQQQSSLVKSLHRRSGTALSM